MTLYYRTHLRARTVHYGYLLFICLRYLYAILLLFHNSSAALNSPPDEFIQRRFIASLLPLDRTVIITTVPTLTDRPTTVK